MARELAINGVGKASVGGLNVGVVAVKLTTSRVCSSTPVKWLRSASVMPLAGMAWAGAPWYCTVVVTVNSQASTVATTGPLGTTVASDFTFGLPWVHSAL